LGENVNIIWKNTEALLDASKETDLKVKAEKTKLLLLLLLMLIFWVLTLCGLVSSTNVSEKHWHYNPEDQHWHLHHCENLKSH
jgi:hypothetical protein